MNTSILTETLLNFITILSGGYSRLIPDALVLMSYLVAIEIVVFGVMVALGVQNLPVEALKKITFIGIFIWIVKQSATLSEVLLNSFVQAGILAGGGGISVNVMKDPSKILDKGIEITGYIYRNLVSGWSPIDAVLYALCILLILLAFCVIAWSIFLAIIEFYIFTIASVILMPFSINKHTSWLAERAIAGSFAMAFKMMIISIIVALSYNSIFSITLPPDPDFEKVIVIVCISSTIAVLCWHAPNMLAGYIAGGPSLSGSQVIAPIFSAAAGAAGGAMAGTRVGSAGVQGAYAGGKTMVSGEGVGAAMKAAVSKYNEVRAKQH